MEERFEISPILGDVIIKSLKTVLERRVGCRAPGFGPFGEDSIVFLIVETYNYCMSFYLHRD